MILTILSKYRYIFFISFLAILWSMIFFKNYQLRECSAKRDELTRQIKQLEIQSKESTARSITAREQAELVVKSSKQDVQRIMSSSVPNDCNASIKWGVEQAKIISS